VAVAYGPRSLELVVENAIETRPAANSGGLGLVGMHERAALLGGSIDAGADGSRFRVHARLPYTGAAA
jgi:signal transduction histidine kinase